jgi:hypothetical protein
MRAVEVADSVAQAASQSRPILADSLAQKGPAIFGLDVFRRTTTQFDATPLARSMPAIASARMMSSP